MSDVFAIVRHAEDIDVVRVTGTPHAVVKTFSAGVDLPSAQSGRERVEVSNTRGWLLVSLTEDTGVDPLRFFDMENTFATVTPPREFRWPALNVGDENTSIRHAVFSLDERYLFVEYRVGTTTPKWGFRIYDSEQSGWPVVSENDDPGFTVTDAVDFKPQWLPDGSAVLLTSGDTSIRSMDRATGVVSTLSWSAPASVRSMAVSRSETDAVIIAFAHTVSPYASVRYLDTGSTFVISVDQVTEGSQGVDAAPVGAYLSEYNEDPYIDPVDPYYNEHGTSAVGFFTHTFYGSAGSTRRLITNLVSEYLDEPPFLGGWGKVDSFSEVASGRWHTVRYGRYCPVGYAYDDGATSASKRYRAWSLDTTINTGGLSFAEADKAALSETGVPLDIAIYQYAPPPPVVDLELSGNLDALTGSLQVYVDWTGAIDPVRTQTFFRCTITGTADSLPDLVVPISSWQATLHKVNADFLQVVIPAADAVASDVIARPNGEIVVERGARFDDGTEQFVEMARAPVEALYDNTGAARRTITLSGYLRDVTYSQVLTRELQDIRTTMTGGDGVSVRCGIDWLLRPGMTAIAGAVTMNVTYINYYVGGGDSWMQVGERF